MQKRIDYLKVELASHFKNQYKVIFLTLNPLAAFLERLALTSVFNIHVQS